MSAHLRRDPATGRVELITGEVDWSIAPSAAPAEEPVTVAKAGEEQRYLLCVVWEPGKHARIAKGVDGRRDFMTEVEVEKAAWRLLADHQGGQSGFAHASFFGLPSPDHAQIVESYVYRGPDWHLSNTGGEDVVVKAGTWLAGFQLDDVAWSAYKQGQITGVSVQGTATRRTLAARSES